MPYITVENLNFNYANSAQPLLDNINFSLNQGELLHICGINGSGKTTLLKLLAGLIVPHAGKVCYQDEQIRVQNCLDPCCYIGHKTGIQQVLSAYEYYKLTYNVRENNLHELFHAASLADIAHTPIAKLSFGQRHRVALFRLMLTQANLWLLDEPFVGLDQTSRDWLNNKLKQHLALNGIIILTSHQALPEDLQSYQVYYL